KTLTRSNPVAITVTCPNPNCRQMATVEDQHAGMTAQCPKCGGTIAVPGAAAAPGVAAPVQLSGANFMSNVERLTGTSQTKMLFWIGLGCLGALVIFTFLPWVGSSAELPGIGVVSSSFIGLRELSGVFQLLLSLAAVGFIVVTVFLNQDNL